MQNYYSILSLNEGASLNEIKRAYRKLAHEYHPDVSIHPNAKEKFIEINEAYESLLNKFKFEEDIKRSKEAFSEETAQSIIDAWLIAEKERMRARARKHASMRYRQFRETQLYQSSDIFSKALIIVSLLLGFFIITGALYGTWHQWKENARLINAGYIGSAIIILFIGCLMLGYALTKCISLFRKKPSL